MKYLRLKDNIKLRKEENDAIIFDQSVEKILNNVERISLNDFYILQLFNGSYSFFSLTKLISKTKNINFNKVANYLYQIMEYYDDYMENLPIRKIRRDVVVERKKDYISNYKYKSKFRLLTPLAVSMVLTNNCFAKCNYCYANGGIDTDDKLDTGTILNVIDECKQMGVSTINLSGGDPFTRSDIYSILKKVVDSKMEYNISTKKILTDKDILELKKANVNKIQLSIDSNSNEICEQLINIKNYYTNMKAVITKLVKEKIKVNINIVATSVNIKTIPSLVDELLKLKVNRIFISPYLNSLGRHDDKFLCTKEMHTKLEESLPNSNKIDYKKPNYEINRIPNISEMQTCSGGKLGLTIYDDGSVGICDRLLKGNVSVGNIKSKSLYEIWNSKELFELVEPDKNKFTGTKCEKCNSFEECIQKKGICYVRTMMFSNKLYNFDPTCPYSTKTIKIY